MRVWLLAVFVMLAGCASSEPEQENDEPDTWEIDIDFTEIFMTALLAGVALAFVGIVIYLLLRDDKRE